MQTRKNRKNDEDSYIRMLKLRRDLNRAVMLLEMVKKREKMKKENLNLTLDVFEKRQQAEDWEGEVVSAAQQARPAPRQQPSYPLTATWVNSVPLAGPALPPAVGAKREKRIYRKRKHGKTGLARPPLSGLRRPDRGLLSGLEQFSSDDDRSSLHTKQSDQELEEAGLDLGPFMFRRKAGVQYHQPLLSNGEQENKEPFSLFAAPPAYGAAERCLGFCRRRLGRGGRVVLDRIPTRWDNSWQEEDMDFTADREMVRPVTPPALQELNILDTLNLRVQDLRVSFSSKL